MQKNFKLLLFLLSLLLYPLWLRADTVYFKDGKQIQGEVMGQDKKEVKFRDENGNFSKIAKAKIRRIKYGTQKVLTPEEVAEQKKAAAKEERRKKEERERQAEEAERQAEEKRRAEAAEQERLEEERERQAEEAERQAEEKRRAEEAEQERLEEERERQEEEKERIEDARNRTPVSVLWRSAILPGWGQFKMENYRSGAVDLGIFGLTAGLVAGSGDRVRSSKEAYNSGSMMNAIMAPIIFSNLSGTTGRVIQNQYLISESQKLQDQYRNNLMMYQMSLAVMIAYYGYQLYSSYTYAPEWVEKGKQLHPEGTSISWLFSPYLDTGKSGYHQNSRGLLLGLVVNY